MVEEKEEEEEEEVVEESVVVALYCALARVWLRSGRVRRWSMQAV